VRSVLHACGCVRLGSSLWNAIRFHLPRSPADAHPWTCAVATYRNEGIRAFFRGFVPAFTRLGPHTILTFVFMEQIKRVLS
jgi:hypothetical protein